MLLKKVNVVLTQAELRNTPFEYLRVRFQNTVINTSKLGIILVESVNADGIHYYPFDEYKGIRKRDLKDVRWSGVGDIVMARPPMGLYNTPRGVMLYYDRAQRQWSWGCSNKRVASVPFSAVPDAAEEHMDSHWLLMMQFPANMMFPQQLRTKDTIAAAISRSHYVVFKKNSTEKYEVYDRFSRKVKQVTKEMEEQIKALHLF